MEVIDESEFSFHYTFKQTNPKQKQNNKTEITFQKTVVEDVKVLLTNLCNKVALKNEEHVSFKFSFLDPIKVVR